MADLREQQLTLSNKIVNVVKTSVVDFIAINSGTCTGLFQTNSFNANSINLTGEATLDHLVANSGTFTGNTTSNTFQGNNGVFLSTLTISGMPVNIEPGGILSLQEDTSPVLGGNLNGNSHNISGVAGVTANTGYFPVSCTAGSFNGNSMSLALTGSMDHVVANSGTYTGNVFSNGVLKVGTFTTTQRNNINAEEGMILINSTSGSLEFYVNGSWNTVANL